MFRRSRTRALFLHPKYTVSTVNEGGKLPIVVQKNSIAKGGVQGGRKRDQERTRVCSGKSEGSLYLSALLPTVDTKTPCQVSMESIQKVLWNINPFIDINVSMPTAQLRWNQPIQT